MCGHDIRSGYICAYREAVPFRPQVRWHLSVLVRSLEHAPAQAFVALLRRLFRIMASWIVLQAEVMARWIASLERSCAATGAWIVFVAQAVLCVFERELWIIAFIILPAPHTS